MERNTYVSRTVDIDGAVNRYEIVQHEDDLFAATLFTDGQPAGPTDFMRSRYDAEHLGEQWLSPRDSRQDD